MAWETIKEYFAEQGATDDITFPKAVLKKAFSAGIIDDEKWLDMLYDRNMASRIYQEEIAASISEHIQSDYVHLFEHLIEEPESVID